MRTLYDEIRSPKKKAGWKPLLPPAVCAAVALALIGLFQWTKGNRAAMNWFIRNVTAPFKEGVSWLCDRVPFAVAEVLWALALLVFLVFFFRTVWLLIRREGRLLRLCRRLLALFAALAFVYCGYTVLWGVNYYGDSFSDRSGIETRGASVDELATLNAAFVQELNRYAGQVERDENGVFCEDLDAIFARTGGLYEGITAEFSFLAGPERTPKRMVSSPIMSRLDFTGFFFPFTAETLLNDDSPACLIPATILHEMAHQRGIAGEDECNFVAILAGLRCDDPVYIYSAALLGYIHLGNALYSVDADAYWEIRSQLNQEVNADLAANNAYWGQFDTKLDQAMESVSTTVYEGFLHSYGQTEGKRSYGMCVDLLVAYYFDHKWAE